MTRSDILIAKVELSNMNDRDVLIEILHNKIENIYDILFMVEKHAKENESKPFADLATLIRSGLES